MNIDKTVIEKFLEKLNQISDVIEFQTLNEDNRTLKFEVKFKPDIFVNGGQLNYSEEYYKLIGIAVNKYFNTCVHFNNTGNIFWIYKIKG